MHSAQKEKIGHMASWKPHKCGNGGCSESKASHLNGLANQHTGQLTQDLCKGVFFAFISIQNKATRMMRWWYPNPCSYSSDFNHSRHPKLERYRREKENNLRCLCCVDPETLRALEATICLSNSAATYSNKTSDLTLLLFLFWLIWQSLIYLSQHKNLS